MIVKVSGVLNGTSFDQLLNVVQLESGKADLISDALVNQIEEHNLIDKVKFFCSDTEATNSGLKGGVCVLLELKLNQKYQRDQKYTILYCRYHIHELYLVNTFRTLCGSTVGDKEAIFVKFQKEFKSLDVNKFKPISTKLINKADQTKIIF